MNIIIKKDTLFDFFLFKKENINIKIDLINNVSRKNKIENILIKYKKNKAFSNFKNKYRFKNNNIKEIIILLNFLIIIYLILPIFSENIFYQKRELNSYSEIILKINFYGNIEIINQQFYKKPDEVYVNNQSSYWIDNNKVNLNQQENLIKIIWNTQLNSSENMFANLSSIKEVDLSDFDFSQISSMKNMFYQCSGLEYIFINKKINTSLLNNMENMFSGCVSLKSLDLTKLDTSSVTTFDYLFYDCSSLYLLNITTFVTSKCLSMKYTFSGSGSLKSLDISNFNTSSVTDIEGMFKFCSSLRFLDLSNFNTNLIKDMQYLFYDCRSLEYVNLLSFNTSLVTNMRRMFSNCSSLTSLNISNFITSKVKNMQYMFSSCNSLKSLDISNFLTSNVETMLHMFSNCNSLQSLDLSNFDTSQVTTMKNMFANCNSLTSLNLLKFNTTLISNLQEMFSNCRSLQFLDIRNFDTSSVSNMQKMFYHCISLKSLDLSSFETSSVDNMCNMFEGNLNLVYINISNFNENSNLDIKNMFKNVKNNIVYCLNNKTNSEQIKSALLEKECSLNDCTNNWNEKLEEIFNEKKNNIKIFYDKCIYGKIKEISDEFYLSNKVDNAAIYSYEIDSNVNELKNKYNNLSFIDFTPETQKFLKKKFNLENEDNIYILISDLPSDDLWTATSYYDFKLLLQNGTELNLSMIDEDVIYNISVPLRNLNLSNFFYEIYFTDQGYDIYDKMNIFYNDICSSAYYDKNDIIIKDRKKYIYPNNVTLCRKNCIYKMVNIDDKRILCECNLNINNLANTNTNKKDTDFLDEIEDEYNNYNFGKYLLNKINYKIFICGYLIFHFKNLIENIGFYLISIFLIVIIFFNVKFFFFGIANIRIKMFEEIPTKEKVKNIIIQQLTKNRHRNSTLKYNPSKKNLVPIKKKSKKKFCITISPNNINRNRKIKTSNEQSYLNIFLTNTNQNLNKNRLKQALNKLRKKNFIDKFQSKYYELYNELPFTKAITQDNRNFFQLFKSILLTKIELANLFISKTNIKDIIICEYLLSLLIDFFFNAFFYSDDVISHKYHNNGRIDFIITLLITLSSNIITSIICHFLNSSNWIEHKIENISEIRNEYKYLKIINKFFKILKIKMICFFISEMIITIFCFYYVVIFCIVYSQTQISLLTTYIASLLEDLIKSVIVTIIIVITRKIGISFLNVYSYNVSKYIYSNF